MWVDTIRMLPIAAILSTVEVTAPVHLEGDAQDELRALLKSYVNPHTLRMVRNKKLDLHIDENYPFGTSLWTIFNSILTKYHLYPSMR